jgi:hypothetical protein
MAKVTGPLMSIDASGAFADTMVYARWKGINYSRQYAIPGNPRTANQLQIRNYFTMVVAAGQAEDQATKDAWNQAASGKPLSGFNLYVGEYGSYRIANGGACLRPCSCQANCLSWRRNSNRTLIAFGQNSRTMATSDSSTVSMQGPVPLWRTRRCTPNA